MIAIDGTAGSGKSTASRGVAARLGLRYLDTGAMYRAMTLQMLRDRIPADDAAGVALRAETVVLEPGTDPLAPTIALAGIDVSTQIRSDPVTRGVSAVSSVPRVRELLVSLQRAVIGTGGIVVEGRDIGTVVAPDADLKMYLTADASARARRRTAELKPDQIRDVAVVETDLLRRDRYDSTRKASPMSVAPDAIQLDTTNLTLAEVIETIVQLARQRLVVAHP
ncbi:MAG: (d)CMP kinase [Nocardioidaceae bacterium]